MEVDEVILTNLYISLQIALAKKKLFEDKQCTIPEHLLVRIDEIEAAIKEREQHEPQK